MNDFFYIFTWWLVILCIGAVFLPLTIRLFPKFADRGYIFSKIIGIISVSFVSFVLGVLHILPFSTWSLYGILIIYLAINILLSKRVSVRKVAGSLWGLWIVEELIFLSGLSFWAFVRAHDPTINGLEKFMDFGFINSILRAHYFPPKDMWFTPLSINYYYFGHMVTAVLTKFSFLPSYITYNLMLATILGFTISCAFSVGLNLVFGAMKKLTKSAILVGILAMILVTFGGNLHTVYQFFHPYQNEHPVPPWTLQFAPLEYPNNYWYPNATRFIPFTIHEFPMYSYVVADLHGHVLSIPFVMTAIALIFELFLIILAGSKKPQKLTKRSNAIIRMYRSFLDFVTLSSQEIGMLVVIGLLISVLYMTNAWDGPIYFMLTSISVVIAFFIKKQDWIIKSIASILIALVSFIVFSLPFSVTFKPFVSGIGVNCAPDFLVKMEKLGPLLFEQGKCQHSALYQWMILWGFFLFFFTAFLIVKFFKRKVTDQLNPIDWFVVGVALLSFFLLIVPEFFYAKDIYPTHFRANTMFKLGYQAFIMMSMMSGYIIIRITKLWRQWWFIFPSLILVLLVLSYPYTAVYSYYGAGQNKLKPYVGLDGLQYLKTSRPDDYQTILWIRNNVSGQPIIVEAQGDSYTDYARLSANTGLPTVLGWTVHEWLWRGSYDVPAPRIEDVRKIYEDTTINETKQLLNNYNVKYVYVGDLEREKYPALFEDKFKTLGSIVFQSGNSRLYKLY